MGDVVHNLPVATDIRRALPDATIDWAVEPLFAPIVSLHPAICHVHAVPLRALKQRWWSPAHWTAMRGARNTLGALSYDMIVDTQGLMKSAWIARWAKGPVAGFDADSAREPAAARRYQHAYPVSRAWHAVERNRALAAAALHYPLPARMDYGLPVTGQAAKSAPVVCLTATSRADKQWPVDCWQSLLGRLRETGQHVILPWGNEAERDMCRRIAGGFDHVSVPSRAPLDGVAQWIAGARIVVGVDTGLAHLAVALGRPTIGLYVTTRPGLTGLYGPSDCVNLGGGTRDAPATVKVETVWDAVRARLDAA